MAQSGYGTLLCITPVIHDAPAPRKRARRECVIRVKDEPHCRTCGGWRRPQKRGSLGGRRDCACKREARDEHEATFLRANRQVGLCG